MTSAHRPVWPWYAAVAGLLAFDQITKALTRAYLPLHESISLIGDEFLLLTHVQNPGSAFGFRVLGLKPLLVFGWGAAIVLVFYLNRLVKRHDLMRWPVMLFLAGAVGNSIDRTLFGQVTDFLDVDFPDFIMPRWPIFNVADSCVTVGIILLIILTLFTRHTLPQAAAAASHAGTSTAPNTSPSDHRAGPAASAD